MKKQKRIGVGALVRIKNPEFFVRCGYPLSPTSPEVVDYVVQWKENVDKIADIILADKQDTLLSLYDKTPSLKDKAVLNFLREMAYIYVKRKKFGGNIRSIHTKAIPDKKDTLFVVNGIKACYTGERVPPSLRSYGEDYEPPFFAGAKYHHILILEPYQSGCFISVEDLLKIEDCHVELETRAIGE